MEGQSVTAFSMLHTERRDNLKRNGQQAPHHTFCFWKDSNNYILFSSFRTLSSKERSALSAQSLSASAKRIFSDLVRHERHQWQTLLSSTVKMSEKISVYVKI